MRWLLNLRAILKKDLHFFIHEIRLIQYPQTERSVLVLTSTKARRNFCETPRIFWRRTFERHIIFHISYSNQWTVSQNPHNKNTDARPCDSESAQFSPGAKNVFAPGENWIFRSGRKKISPSFCPGKEMLTKNVFLHCFWMLQNSLWILKYIKFISGHRREWKLRFLSA